MVALQYVVIYSYGNIVVGDTFSCKSMDCAIPGQHQETGLLKGAFNKYISVYGVL